MNIMNTIQKNDTRAMNGGWTKCQICKQNVYDTWWTKYKHCLGHASRCLPWDSIMGIAFGIFL